MDAGALAATSSDEVERTTTDESSDGERRSLRESATDEPARARGGEIDLVDGEPPKATGNWLVEMLRPRPGEGFLDYRDRVLPIAQAVVAPQRRRVGRIYDSLLAELDEETQKDVAAILDRTQDQLKNRILGAVVGGELDPASMRPIDGVVFARDVLDLVVTADGDLRKRLGSDAALLDDAGFDVVDHLAFATRWEDILFVTDDAM